MMERDDISVVLEGLYPDFARQFSFDLLAATFQSAPYNKFRVFDRMVDDVTQIISYKEREDFFSMLVSEFVTYMEMVKSGNTERSLSYTDIEGQQHILPSVKAVAIYMIDVDMPKLMPHLDEEYVKSFRMPEILPAGRMCMTNGVSFSSQSRPCSSYLFPDRYVLPCCSSSHYSPRFYI